MTMKKSDRLFMEEQYQAVNNSPDSVCTGSHYIAKRKIYEKCKHCGICAKYKKGCDENGDNVVKFHYVDSFRECEFYKTCKKSSKETGTPKRIHVPIGMNSAIITPERKIDLAAQAYIDLCKRNQKLLDYLTWSELFAIICMQHVVDEMNREITGTKFLKGRAKQSYGFFWRHYLIYRSRVREMCFKSGDERVVQKFASDISNSFQIMRYSIEFYLNKNRIERAEEMSYLLNSLEMIGLVKDIHIENDINIKKQNPNASLSKYLCPEALLNELYLVISLVDKMYSSGREIHLNNDSNIVNGINAIKNKVRNPHIISEIIYNIDLYHSVRN